MPAKRILHKFKLNEISAVDRPAQIHATALIMKRAKLDPDLPGDEDSPKKTKSAGKSVDTKTKTPGGSKMPKEKTLDELTSENETLKKQMAVLTTLSAFSDEEKTFYKGLDESAQAAFIAKSAQDRTDEVEMSKSADPVIYTSLDGSQFRKSDDSRIVASAKRADLMEKRFNEAAEKSNDLSLEKRAAVELGKLPGEAKVHINILKALDTIKDETDRAAALTAIRAGAHAMTKNFERRGSSEEGGGKTALEQLDNIAKKHAKDNNMDFYKAYDEVLKTPEGSELYSQTLN